MRKLVISIPNDRDKLYRVIQFPTGGIQVWLTREGISACIGADQYVIEASPVPDLVELAQLKDALERHFSFRRGLL
jgi:hypothetical protein